MSEIKQIGDNDFRIILDTFGAVDRATHPTKLPIDALALAENWAKTKQLNDGSLVKRNGVRVYNTNELTASRAVRNLYEAKLKSAYYLIAKDADGSGTSDLKYLPYTEANKYTRAWSFGGTPSTAEYQNYYQFETFKNAIYICNRHDGSALSQNRVWSPDKATGSLFEHGCIPPQWTTFPAFTGVSLASGGLTNGYYWYVVTFIYEGYQESGACDGYWSGSALGAIQISGIPLGNARVTARNIYRSTVLATDVDLYSFPQYLYYVGTINDNTSTTYTDTLNDNSLGEAIPSEQLFELARPYQARCQVAVNDYLLQANLEDDAGRYSALASDDVTAVKQTGGGFLSAGNYKYRIYKAYAQHSGGQYVYILGDYVEKSVTGVNAFDSVLIDIVPPAEVLTNEWVESIVIMRTLVGGSDFYPVIIDYGLASPSSKPHVAWHKGHINTNHVLDGLADNDLASLAGQIGAVFIYSGGKGTLPPSKVARDKQYEGTLVYSEVGNPDRFLADSIKQVLTNDQLGICSMFAEKSRVVIYTANGIYELGISAQSPTFWNINKLVSEIGAKGSNAERTGHSGVVQLPEESGYLFFNRTYAIAGESVRVYYWDGSATVPQEISTPIDIDINSGFTTLEVRGMAYDPKNNWVWMTVVTNASKKVYIFDLVYKQWQVWTFNSAIDIYDVTVVQDGSVLIGAGDGRILKYTPDTYQDSYGGASPTDYSYTALLRTKTFQLFDGHYIAKMVSVNAETTSNTVSMSGTLVTEADSTALTLANAGATTKHRLKHRLNKKNRQMYVEASHSENKGLTINSLNIDGKIKHQRDGSY